VVPGMRAAAAVLVPARIACGTLPDYPQNPTETHLRALKILFLDSGRGEGTSRREAKATGQAAP